MLERTSASLKSLGAKNDSRLLVAVSGGPDSIALAHVIHSLRETGTFAEMAIAHVNHRLRGANSDRDEEAVTAYARKWNVNLYAKTVDTLAIAETKKTGIEETARMLRYTLFEELIDREHFDFVLTAHTANDQAETIVMNLMRGAGVRGLAGIPKKRTLGNGFILRPWLDVTKEDILGYLTERELQFQTDETNAELTFRRNRVRHTLLPALAEIWPDRSPVNILASFGARMRELSQFLDTLTNEKLHALELDGGLSLPQIQSVEGFLFHATIEAWIQREFGHYGLTSEERSRIRMWIASTSPRMELRRGLSLRKDGDVLRLENDGRHLK